MRRLRPLLSLAGFLLAAPAAGQTPEPAAPPAGAAPAAPTSPATPAPAPALVRLVTPMGAITVEVDRARAPITAANFLRYVDGRRLDGTVFYRAFRQGPEAGLVQFGTRGDPRRVLPKIAHEPTTQTGLSHTDGAISMARGAPGTADGDFFIIVGATMTGLDANPAAAGDNQGYAVFGRVVEGMEVVRAILAAPTSPTEGEGVMRGQMLGPPVPISSARRVERPAGP
jgi:peptidyl-prolyl cis-trans isomerase A (cyclophilin A)